MNKIEIFLTETTIKDILYAIEEAKKCCNKDIIDVKSEYSNINFKIEIEKNENTQESLGYRLDFPENKG